MYTVIKNYRDNEELRASFNKLAEKTFGLNFEAWYQNGFWGDNYNPYSIVIDGKVVANVSVNKTDMLYEGKVKRFIQLGTVMTDEAYRNQGLSRKIMEQIERDYAGKVDGVYLFGNDEVLEFYPKFGFTKGKEYLYSKVVSNTEECQMEQVIMNNPTVWQQLVNAMNATIFHGKLDMVDNNELIMFYVTNFMQESVYYHNDTDTYVIADIEDGSLFIHNVFSSKLDNLDEVIKLFGAGVKKVVLGFTPKETEGFEVIDHHEDDCTFFVKGAGLDIMEKDKLRIPSLSHA